MKDQIKPNPTHVSASLLDAIGAGNMANAKAQAIELDRLRAMNAELARALQSIVFYWDSPEMAKLPASTMAQARAALAKANHD